MEPIPKTIPVRNRADPFVIEEVIGEGGMGKVYRAHDPASGAMLAVKVLGEVGDPTRFAVESDILSKLQHPNIVAYRAHGLTQDGHPYLAMEWIDGEDLDKRLERANLTVDETLRVARAITDALAAAHAAGVIHRDLKPSNVLLTRATETVKLVDFGIARASHVEGLTKTGQALGTPGYMSPEQARGRRVDTRSDLFSLGCLLFRCLGGRRPFAGADIMQFATSLALEEPPPLRELAEAVPSDLEALVARLLEKDPARRPESALDVGKELDRIRAGADRAALAPTASANVPPARAIARDVATAKSPEKIAPPKSRRLPTALWLGVLAAAGVVFAIGYRRGVTTKPEPLSPPAPAPVGSGSAPAIDRSGLDRACKKWGAALAHFQHPDGSFAGEERAPASGWDTAQQLFALAEAHRACDGATVATLAAGARALGTLRAIKGWIGPRPANFPTKEAHGESSAGAWAVLALTRIAEGTHDEAATALLAEARADVQAARNADGGYRRRPIDRDASVIYPTTLAAWALDDGDAFAWLERAVVSEGRGTRSLGFSEQLAWVVRGRSIATRQMLARELVAHCGPDADGSCTRPAYETGRIPYDVDSGPDQGLVALWHPWATLAAATYARDASLDAPTRKILAGIARWGAGELTSSVDVLGAAPGYKLAEYLIVVSELLQPEP